MFEYDVNFINKFKEAKTLRELAKEEGLTELEIYKKIMDLQNQGLVFEKVILDNGNINYYIKKHQPLMKTNSILLNLRNHLNLSSMLISDTHFGNELENLRYLDAVYNYCKDNDIHIIINGGDLVDGTFTNGKQTIVNPINQVKYLLENYPFDNKILNLICLGNHDHSLYKCGVDIKKILESSRYDLIPIGYGLGIINVENDQIFIRHSIPDYKFEDISGRFVLEGHKHKAAFTDDGKGFLINIPSLSDLTLGKHAFPGAIKMNLFFDENGFITSGMFEQFAFNGKMNTVNEILLNFNLTHGALDENLVRPRVKSIKYGSNSLSQIDKFNKRMAKKSQN